MKDWETLPMKSGGRLYVTLLDNVQVVAFKERGVIDSAVLNPITMSHVNDVIKSSIACDRDIEAGDSGHHMQGS